ncbi:hypothetical protein [Sporosarcina sp. E16_8]|uniref:hypothetical protein n=1 Tax=Sporosarcina sp. E16_8 TaxID=2789295 RepID=UPI001A931222|nr:hypothetical protein [Sporosarcina sp. E16_8]MBO0589605.1 hypothetical protein [Sporosarcina sp. E16_8]
MNAKKKVLLGIILALMIFVVVFHVILGIESKWMQILILFIVFLWGYFLLGKFNDK